MKPYYTDGQITIYHGDARDVVPHLRQVDLVLTDPPFGVNGGRGHHARLKVQYRSDLWQDATEYVEQVCVPVFRDCMAKATRSILTPGRNNIHRYPVPNDVGILWFPAPSGFGPWGSTNFTMVFYYGKDPRAGKPWTVGRAVYKSDRVAWHPCPKPLDSWQWLLAKGSVSPNDIVLDPFMGSGTTLRAAKNLGRAAIGIEIEERYCEGAANRLTQEVLQLDVPAENAKAKGEADA